MSSCALEDRLMRRLDVLLTRAPFWAVDFLLWTVNRHALMHLVSNGAAHDVWPT